MNAHSAELSRKVSRERLEKAGQMAMPLGAEQREDLIESEEDNGRTEDLAPDRALVITDFSPPAASPAL